MTQNIAKVKNEKRKKKKEQEKGKDEKPWLHNYQHNRYITILSLSLYIYGIHFELRFSDSI